MVESGVYMFLLRDSNGLQGVVTADALLNTAAETAYWNALVGN